jgi:hypothetical protein
MLSLTVAFAAAEPQHWRMQYEIGPLRQAENLVQILLGLAWCYIVVRLIQEEAPAGDRQFWITRPYSWKSLWAAKLLFIVTFINIPVVIADAKILAAAGFPPGSHLMVLVWKQIALTAGLASAAAVAAVTRNLLEFGVASLVAALYAVVLGWFYRAWPLSSWIQVSILTAIVLGTASALVFYQYARRRTVVSRAVLAGLALFILLAMSRITWTLVVSRQFAALASQTSGTPALVFDPDPARRPSDKFAYGTGDSVTVRIPFRIAGLPEGTDIESEIAKVGMEAPGGQNWTNYGQFHATSAGGEAQFRLKKRLFDDIKSTPVALRFSVLLTLLRDEATTKAMLRDGDLMVPNVFNCAAYGDHVFLLCRTALVQRRSIRVRVDVPEPCPSAPTVNAREATPHSQPRVSKSWAGGYPEIMDFDISPVRAFYMMLDPRPNSTESNSGAGARDCPDTQIDFTTESPAANIRRDVEIRGLRLADYAIQRR